MDERVFRTTSRKLVEAEERTILLTNLVKCGVGLSEIEEYICLESEKFKGKSCFQKRKEIINSIMKS